MRADFSFTSPSLEANSATRRRRNELCALVAANDDWEQCAFERFVSMIATFKNSNQSQPLNLAKKTNLNLEKENKDPCRRRLRRGSRLHPRPPAPRRRQDANAGTGRRGEVPRGSHQLPGHCARPRVDRPLRGMASPLRRIGPGAARGRPVVGDVLCCVQCCEGEVGHEARRE